jgi:hypothetical protein
MGFFDDIGNAIGSAASWVGDKVRSVGLDPRSLAAIAVGTVAFVGLTVLTGGADLPLLATLLIAGGGSGIAGQLTYDLLGGQKPGFDVLAAGVVSAAFTVAGAGVGKIVGPVVGDVLERVGVTRFVQQLPVVQALTRAAGEAEGDAGSRIGSLLGFVKESEARFGSPRILDPTVYDGAPARPAPEPALPVPEPSPPPSSPGLVHPLETAFQER